MYNVTNNSTQAGPATPFGLATPFRLPNNDSIAEDLLSLVTDLYPTGRAFAIPEQSEFKKLHTAINQSLLRLIQASKRVIDNNIPDTIFFEENDCELWEYRLGLTTNTALTLAQRREIIYNRMGYPKNIKARQNYRHIQNQLQLNGFNVGVYENIFFTDPSDVATHYYLDPSDISNTSLPLVQHGGGTQHGFGTQHGSTSYDVIANEMFIEDYAVGGANNLWATFFIAHPTDLYQRAIIDSSRMVEFKEQVLKLKPAHTVAYTFIN